MEWAGKNIHRCTLAVTWVRLLSRKVLKTENQSKHSSSHVRNSALPQVTLLTLPSLMLPQLLQGLDANVLTIWKDYKPPILINIKQKVMKTVCHIPKCCFYLSSRKGQALLPTLWKGLPSMPRESRPSSLSSSPPRKLHEGSGAHLSPAPLLR